jgi:hypothetical protein
MASLDRRKVTMRAVGLSPDGDLQLHEATDYVDLEHLDAYVADARTRWQSVIVGEETDHGPGGEDGHYDVQAATSAPEIPVGHPNYQE